MSWRDLPTVPGPYPRPLVPGHLGVPGERACHDMACCLGLAEVMGPEFVAAVEQEIVNAGVSPNALRRLSVRRIDQGRWPLHVSSAFLNPGGAGL